MGFLAVVPKGRCLLTPGRHHLDDLQVTMGLNFIFGYAWNVNDLPGVSHHASVSELGGGTVCMLWFRQHVHVQGSTRLTVIRMRKRERCELLFDCFTWCSRGDALCKQTTEKGFFCMVDDVNGCAERCVDWVRSRSVSKRYRKKTYRAYDRNP
jgi:hypothetical protein